MWKRHQRLLDYRPRYESLAAVQEAVGRLFADERDPIVVMKWKETLDFLEAATDRCEDVANIVEGIILENS